MVTLTAADLKDLVTAAIEASHSKPEETITDVAQLDGDGKVVKQQTLVTRRRIA